MEDAELQNSYLEFQMLDQQLKQAQKQLQLLEEQLVEIIFTIQSLDELKEVKQGTEILVPVNSGVYAHATLGEVKDVVVNVGAGTAVEKSILSTKEMLSKQLEEVQTLRQQLVQFVSKMETELISRQKDLSDRIGE